MIQPLRIAALPYGTSSTQKPPASMSRSGLCKTLRTRPSSLTGSRPGVPVRVLVDPRANTNFAGNGAVLEQLKAAGIPMRYKVGAGILHWKMMLFAGQNKLEFSGANYSGNFFVPDAPNSNYFDEAIYFTNDPALIQSFKTKLTTSGPTQFFTGTLRISMDH